MKEAGRELDALVAEKVMQLAPRQWRSICFVDDHELDARVWCYDCCGSVGEQGQVPEHYSTDIAAAWQVVEMLYKRGFGVGVVMQHGWDTACECIVFKTSIVDDDTIHASADTAPHAICLAALAVLGVEP